jgi:hypothetical protein
MASRRVRWALAASTDWVAALASDWALARRSAADLLGLFAASREFLAVSTSALA